MCLKRSLRCSFVIEARFVRHTSPFNYIKEENWLAVYVFVLLLSHIANHEVNKRALFLPFFPAIFNSFTFPRDLLNRKRGGLCYNSKGK